MNTVQTLLFRYTVHYIIIGALGGHNFYMGTHEHRKIMKPDFYSRLWIKVMALWMFLTPETICERIWEKGPLRAKSNFFSTFQIHHSMASRAPGFPFGSLGLLLYRYYSKPSILRGGEPPNWGIKQWFSNVIDALARPAHKGNGRGLEFLMSVTGWWKSIHAKFKFIAVMVQEI